MLFPAEAETVGFESLSPDSANRSIVDLYLQTIAALVSHGIVCVIEL